MPPAHLIELLLMTVQPLIQLGAVGIDSIDESIPKPSELTELLFQVIALGSEVVSVITNDEHCHRGYLFLFLESAKHQVSSNGRQVAHRLSRLSTSPFLIVPIPGTHGEKMRERRIPSFPGWPPLPPQTVAPLTCLWCGLTSMGVRYRQLGSEIVFKGADGALRQIDRELF